VRLSQAQVLVAEAKTGIVFFDYKSRKVQKVPQKFAEKFS
jgi:acyl-CoA thioesterase FadM